MIQASFFSFSQVVIPLFLRMISLVSLIPKNAGTPSLCLIDHMCEP